MHNDLSQKKCLPCEGEERHLMASEVEEYLKQIPEWKFEEFHHLRRKFIFNDFKDALAFANKIGALAEAEGHHPDMTVGWGYVGIKLFTHSLDGLSENDFIMAAKIDTLR